MVVTILEASVAPESGAALEREFGQGVTHLDPGIVETFLLRASKDASQWRIVTVWESREALDAMRRTNETPRGVLMFRAVGAEPGLTVFEVAAHAAAQ